MSGTEYRQKRIDAGLTMEQLGKIIGVHWTTISRRERGEIAISQEAALAVSKLKARKPLKTKGEIAAKNN